MAIVNVNSAGLIDVSKPKNVSSSQSTSFTWAKTSNTPTLTYLDDNGVSWGCFIFNSSGTFRCTKEGMVKFLLVGGGGGGSVNNYSGAYFERNQGQGGGGSVIESEAKFVVGVYDITVGAGGVEAFASTGATGGTSSIKYLPTPSRRLSTDGLFIRATGGSGGSSSNPGPSIARGGTSGDGYAGGVTGGAIGSGATGGGAGGPGASDGADGPPVTSSITGTPTFYASGSGGAYVGSGNYGTHSGAPTRYGRNGIVVLCITSN
jgi:hypothetical protein